MDNNSDTTGSNGTNSTDSPMANLFTAEIQIGVTLAYAIIFIIGLVGNSLGLLVVWKSSSASVTNLFIANMAVADLILTLTVMPFSVMYLYIQNLWLGGVVGNVTCKMFFYVIPVSIAASVLTMFTISIDRFYAIFYPLREKFFRKPKILSAIIWMLSLVLMVPNIFLYKTISENGQSSCIQDWPWADHVEETYRVLTIFHICLFVILYAVPLSMTGIVYFLIARKLWLRKIPGNVTDSNRAAVEKSRRKVVRLLVVIVIVFAVCWFPNYTNHFFLYLEPQYWPKIPMAVRLLFFWIAHANSAVNPCLYILLNGTFRKELAQTLSCFPCLSRFRPVASLSRIFSMKHDGNHNSMSGSMWKLMSLGRATAYTLQGSTSEREGENGNTNLSLTKLSRKDESTQMSCINETGTVSNTGKSHDHKNNVSVQ